MNIISNLLSKTLHCSTIAVLFGTTEAEPQYNKIKPAGAERSVIALVQRPVMLRAASCYALGSRPPKIVVAIGSELCGNRSDSVSIVHVICNDPHNDSTPVAASRVTRNKV